MSLYKYIFILTSVFLLNFSLAHANSLKEQLKEANTQYEAGKYAESAVLYENILESGYESTAVYFNLGNAYYQQQKTAGAVLNFERAKRISPNDSEIEHNLGMAKELISIKIDSYPVLFYKRWSQNVVHFFSSGMWSLLALLAMWLFVACVLFFILKADGKQKKQTFFGSLAAFSCAILFLFLAYNKYISETKQDEAIIFAETISLKSGPSQASKDLDSVAAGTKVIIEDKIEEWVKVILSDEKEGWIELKDLEVI